MYLRDFELFNRIHALKLSYEGNEIYPTEANAQPVIGTAYFHDGWWLALICNSELMAVVSQKAIYPLRDLGTQIVVERIGAAKRIIRLSNKHVQEQFQYQIDLSEVGERIFFYQDEEMVDFGIWIANIWRFPERQEIMLRH